MRHPETEDGEILYCNVDIKSNKSFLKHCRWKTARIGKVAYNIYGDIISIMQPVFIQIAEIAGVEYKLYAELNEKNKTLIFPKKKKNTILEQGQPVLVFGFGDDEEYAGIICGYSGVGERVNHYIVKMIDTIPNSYSENYDCMLVVPECIKLNNA